MITLSQAVCPWAVNSPNRKTVISKTTVAYRKLHDVAYITHEQTNLYRNHITSQPWAGVNQEHFLKQSPFLLDGFLEILFSQSITHHTHATCHTSHAAINTAFPSAAKYVTHRFPPSQSWSFSIITFSLCDWWGLLNLGKEQTLLNTPPKGV